MIIINLLNDRAFSDEDACLPPRPGRAAVEKNWKDNQNHISFHGVGRNPYVILIGVDIFN
jgi:hypothetical protein